jgi:hypothetical protein
MPGKIFNDEWIKKMWFNKIGEQEGGTGSAWRLVWAWLLK